MFGPNASLSQRDKSVAAKTETPIESQTEKSSLGATKKPAKAETGERETKSLEDHAQDSPAQSSPQNPFRKRPASERKIQANRQNALRSTGPKTERGKRTVSCNAIKHGFLAREVVITAGDGEEGLEEFHDLVEQFCEYYEPVVVVEESLVQTIATCWWRKARVIRAENGEIRMRLDTLAKDRALRDSDKGNHDLTVLEGLLFFFYSENRAERPELTEDGRCGWRDALRDLRKHQPGLLYLTVLLEKAKSEIASDGYPSETTRTRIFHTFSNWDHCLAFAFLNFNPPEARMKDGPSEKVRDKQVVDEQDEQTDKKRADSIAAMIDDRLERLSALVRELTVRENLSAAAEARSFSLPAAEATDKLLRYESHLDRQLYRAMDQLERLQRRRRGEIVPSPLNINLERRT